MCINIPENRDVGTKSKHVHLFFIFATGRAKWRFKDFYLVKPVSMWKDIMIYFKLEDAQFCFFCDFERKLINGLYCI